MKCAVGLRHISLLREQELKELKSLADAPKSHCQQK